MTAAAVAVAAAAAPPLQLATGLISLDYTTAAQA
jgi:hypothetical protein